MGSTRRTRNSLEARGFRRARADLLQWGLLAGRRAGPDVLSQTAPPTTRARTSLHLRPERRSLIADCEPSLADPTAVAETATSLPSSSDLQRVQKLTREPFVLEGEDLADALGPGSPRRVAFDAAMAELREGATTPSIGWRRTWSLLLGLERLLGVDEPTLADGTVLNAHQVDALS